MSLILPKVEAILPKVEAILPKVEAILPKVEAILAVDLENGLAKNGKIPWKSKKDLQFFKDTTINHTVIMGSTTLLSLPNGQPLKNRTNIVLTNNKEKYLNIYKNVKNLYFLRLDETIQVIKNNITDKFFIIGGSQIYNLLLPYCSCIWLTKMKHAYNCNLKFDFPSVIISTYTRELIYEDAELEIICLRI
jgi:dihydrofolate reductase